MIYPTKITEEVLQKNEHIKDEEIAIDIIDTNIEINHLKMEINRYRLISEATDSARARISQFRKDGKGDELKDKLGFVQFLIALQEARK